MESHGRRFSDDRSGVTALEYAFVAGLMAVVIIAAMGVFAPRINTLSSRP